MTDELPSPPEGMDDPIARCPACGASNIWSRRNKTPLFRCGKCTEEFDEPKFTECRKRYGIGTGPVYAGSNMEDAI
jgi:ribosomal protein L37AE/L43A